MNDFRLSDGPSRSGNQSRSRAGRLDTNQEAAKTTAQVSGLEFGHFDPSVSGDKHRSLWIQAAPHDRRQQR
jgi:hypothetical protein